MLFRLYARRLEIGHHFNFGPIARAEGLGRLLVTDARPLTEASCRFAAGN